MIEDIRTMMWKEFRSLLRYQGRRSQLVFSLLTPLIMAVYLPWELGEKWASGYFSLFVSMIIPMMVCGIAVPDSFAGERERHTLETLLASRLPDRAILFAKMLISVMLSLGLTLVILLLSLVTLNIVHRESGLIFYRPMVIFANLIFSLAFALFATELGVLFSLRSPTVQQAQQTLFSVLMLPPMLLGFAAMIIMGMADGAEIFRELVSTLNADQIVWIVIGVFVLINAGLLVLDLTRFQRAKLVLD